MTRYSCEILSFAWDNDVIPRVTSPRYPCLEIDLEKLTENVRFEVELLKKYGVSIMGVNKVFNGLRATAQALIDGGLDSVAESRLYNLKKLAALPCKKVLLRSPSLSEVEDTVRYADVSLNSDFGVIHSLSMAAVNAGKNHEILLMIDMGDLREGMWFENFDEILALVTKVSKLPALKFYGIGTNFNCFGAIKPSVINGQAFVQLVRRLESETGLRFAKVSGGNCTSYHLMDKGQWVEGINELRIGGLHQFGIEYVDVKYVEGFHHSKMPIERVVSDLYKLKAEIIEVNLKPTVPVGESGVDAFLKPKTFQDRGPRRRAILSLGRQDLPFENIWPCDESLLVIGQSSDHTIVDIHDSAHVYQVGDTLEFEIDYTALLHACQSGSIAKVFRGRVLE